MGLFHHDQHLSKCVNQRDTVCSASNGKATTQTYGQIPPLATRNRHVAPLPLVGSGERWGGLPLRALENQGEPVGEMVNLMAQIGSQAPC